MKRFLVWSLFLMMVTSSFAARKALVIGNENYDKAKLSSPINDAYETAITLDERGFEVTLLKDAGLKQMNAVIDSFTQNLAKGDEALFYYSGLAAKYKGKGYLIPIGIKVHSIKCLYTITINTDELFEKFAQARSSVFIFETNHNKKHPRLYSWYMGLPLQKGIQGKQAIFISRPANKYSLASENSSRFTSVFMKQVRDANLSLSELAENTSSTIRLQTKGKQNPYHWIGIETDFFINPPPEEPVIQKEEGTFQLKRLPIYRSRFRLEGGGSYAF